MQADVKCKVRDLGSVSRRLQNFSSIMLQHRSARFHRRALSVIAKSVRKAKNLGAYLIEHQIKTLRDEIPARRLRSHLDKRWSLPRSLQQIPVRGPCICSPKKEPLIRQSRSDTFDGEPLLLQGDLRRGEDEPYIARYEDPTLGWSITLAREVSGAATFPVAIRACSRSVTCESWRTSCSCPSTCLHEYTADSTSIALDRFIIARSPTLFDKLLIACTTTHAGP